MKIIPNLYKKLTLARQFTWGSYLLLLAVLAISSITREQPVELLIITLLPLLIFIPGLIRERYKSLSMLCFVSLLYFVIAVTNLFAPNRIAFDIVELVLIVVMFSAAMMFSRWKQYSLYQPRPSEN